MRFQHDVVQGIVCTAILQWWHYLNKEKVVPLCCTNSCCCLNRSGRDKSVTLSTVKGEKHEL